MPELTVLKLLALARRVLRTSPNIKTQGKDRYIARHKKNEDHGLSGVKTAGFWSKILLWNKPTLEASVDDINKKFKHLNVKMT